MLLYIKQLFQLLLEPTYGWEDISEANRPADVIQKSGFFPWIGVTAASCFLQLFYDNELTFLRAVQTAIAIAGAMFISLFVSRLLLDILLPKYVDPKISSSKISVFNLHMVGLLGVYLVFANLMPATLTFLYILPFLSFLVIFKSITFMGVKEENAISFLLLSALAVWATPILIALLLTYII